MALYIWERQGRWLKRVASSNSGLSIQHSPPSLFIFFCSKCGSPIYAAIGENPEFVRVRLGGLNFEPETKITGHMWVNEKPEWCVIADELPQYETIYDGSKD